MRNIYFLTQIMLYFKYLVFKKNGNDTTKIYFEPTSQNKCDLSYTKLPSRKIASPASEMFISSSISIYITYRLFMILHQIRNRNILEIKIDYIFENVNVKY